MNLKEKKAVAREILEEAHSKEGSIKSKSNFVGLEFNEKGKFFSAIMEVEINYKSKLGSINMVKNIPIPVNLSQDVVIKEKEETESKPKPKTRKKKAEDAPVASI